MTATKLSKIKTDSCENESQIILFGGAERMLQRKGIRPESVNVAKLKSESNRLCMQKDELNSSYKGCQRELTELDLIQQNMEQFLNIQTEQGKKRKFITRTDTIICFIIYGKTLAKIIANSVFSKYSILHKKQKEDAVFKEDCPSSLITKISIFHNSYMQHFTILYKIKKIQ